MKEVVNKDNIRNFLSVRLKSMVNKLDVLASTNQCEDIDVYKEFSKLKNELLSDLRLLYNDENIKLEFVYELSKNNISVITCKALNNFSHYLLNGYDYEKIKEMNVIGDDLVTETGKHYEKLLNNNFRKHEL